MESWSLEHYQKPVLCAGTLHINDGEGIQVGEVDAELEIQCEDPCRVLTVLSALKSSNSSEWDVVKKLDDADELGIIISALNENGLIRETLSEHTVEKKSAIIKNVIDEAYNALFPWKESLLVHATELKRFINESQGVFAEELLISERNIFLLYAKISIVTWRQLYPSAIPVTNELLERLTDTFSESHPVDFNAFWAGEARKCLSVIAWSLVRSLDADAARKKFPELVISSPDSGINLALRLERWAKDCLEGFGTARFPAALKTNSHKQQKTLIQAVYAQEYYITERFIDLVSNAMALRLPRPLKKQLRRYYSEEMGHESYELRTCISLGLDEEDINNSLPVPFAQLLCDTYTWLAGNHVVAYAAAATITEGLPGQPNIINEAVATSGIFSEEVNESSRKHEILNEKLNHPYISRILLAECGEQSIKTQQTARDFYGFLLEMTWRTWEELEKFHVQMKRPALSYSIKDFLHL